MKTKFPGYFQLSQDEMNNLWDKAIIALDANILLNLYRYSDETRKEFLIILKHLKSRLWIPHQAVQEFLDNRLIVINQQEKTYIEAKTKLLKIEEEFKDTRKHPFIENKLLNNFTILNKEICDQLEERRKLYSEKVTDDDILIDISKLLTNKIGEEFHQEEIDKLCKEGEERYSKKIPPGYKDSGKNNEEKNIKQYGDFVVWKQILSKSKESEKDVIFITDDRKEDWWLIFNGKTISPRPELVKEFKEFTSHTIYMYQSDRFYEYAMKYSNKSVNEKTFNEISELIKSDEKNQRDHRSQSWEKARLAKRIDFIKQEKKHLETDYSNLLEKQNNLINRMNEIQKNSDSTLSDNYANYFNLIKQELISTSEGIKNIRNKLEKLEAKEIMMEYNISNNQLDFL
ncbi:MAG: hypothetical protein BGO34_10140 [Bacteroidia bacterium 44-10]|nr:MAG: hypothetical protein BGO34_10140 [Bacteroidia bacterium 44-10]